MTNTSLNNHSTWRALTPGLHVAVRGPGHFAVHAKTGFQLLDVLAFLSSVSRLHLDVFRALLEAQAAPGTALLPRAEVFGRHAVHR